MSWARVLMCAIQDGHICTRGGVKKKEFVLPYRLTWEIIRRHKQDRAIVLTTHSMEEADILCDRIAIMADGRLAAVGSSLDLKTRFGVG